jgi:choline dehydrogenase-like flavoprotein
MLADAGTGRDRFAKRFDVCVIGAGPAGITLARTLAARGLDVALMEAGGLEFSAESQAFYAGENVGIESYPTDESRLRYLGGTSGHWEGKCRALDPHDFEARPWVPLSGWPIAKADLDPYQARAAEILDLDSPTELPDIPVTQAEPRFRRFEWRWSPPTLFGEKYRAELAASERIALCLGANLVDVRLSDDLGTVTGAVFKSYAEGDPGFTVRARAYALCLGGMENPRALLNCRSQVPAGIGNGHDVVGRYFCDRPTVYTSNLLLAEPIGSENLYFAATRAFLEAEQVANFAVSLEPKSVRAPQSLAGVLSSTTQCITPAVARLVARLRGRRPQCYVGGTDEFAIRNDPDAHPFAAVGVTTEQVLNPDSRVSLAEARDAFGLNRLRVDWRLTETDYRTIRASALAFGAHVAEQDIGRLKLRPWLLEEPMAMPGLDSGNGLIAGRQHMCTTRMSADPRTGVVDADCRVHGLANLYIGGSSVFATAGYAKPTYTIVQLALRLGDHLGGLLTA